MAVRFSALTAKYRAEVESKRRKNRPNHGSQSSAVKKRSQSAVNRRLRGCKWQSDDTKSHSKRRHGSSRQILRGANHDAKSRSTSTVSSRQSNGSQSAQYGAANVSQTAAKSRPLKVAVKRQIFPGQLLSGGTKGASQNLRPPIRGNFRFNKCTKKLSAGRVHSGC